MINKFQNLINDVFLTRRIQNFVINHPDDLDEYTQVTTDSEVVDGIAHSISDWEWENLSYREVKVYVAHEIRKYAYFLALALTSYPHIINNYQLIDDMIRATTEKHEILSVVPVVLTDDCAYHKVNVKCGRYIVSKLKEATQADRAEILEQIYANRELTEAQMDDFFSQFVGSRLYNIKNMIKQNYDYDFNNGENLKLGRFPACDYWLDDNWQQVLREVRDIQYLTHETVDQLTCKWTVSLISTYKIPGNKNGFELSTVAQAEFRALLAHDFYDWINQYRLIMQSFDDPDCDITL